MNELLPPALHDALPLVVLFWLASVLLLLFCARKYLASRALNGLPHERALHETFARVDVEPAPIAPLHDPPTDDYAAEDQQPGDAAAAAAAAATATAPLASSPASDLRGSVLARIESGGASARALSDLIRALYLDQSNFRFQAIAELEPEDRRLAELLIERWLANPTAVDYWEAMYATACGPLAARPAQQA